MIYVAENPCYKLTISLKLVGLRIVDASDYPCCGWRRGSCNYELI
jgi:hypothetical protein